MSDIGAGINQKLLATAGVAAICGTRGYPDALPINETLPAYTYAIVSDNSEHHMGGFAALAQARIQFDCFALTRKAANELGTAIRKAIQGERGTWGGAPERTPGVTSKRSIFSLITRSHKHGDCRQRHGHDDCLRNIDVL